MNEADSTLPGTGDDDLRRQLRQLRRAVIVLAVGWVAIAGWVASNGPEVGPVLALERLEIVEPGGQLAFVLTNSQRPQAATMDGQVIMWGQEEERRIPSFIFFDGKGDEVGGMTMGVQEGANGFQATRHISLDGYKQDQTVVLAHYQNPNGALSGLLVSDRPRELSVLDAMGELGLEPGATREEMQAAIAGFAEAGMEERLGELFGVSRVFVGSSRSDAAELVLRDGRGRPRILISVPADGEPSIRILDEAGEEVARIPG